MRHSLSSLAHAHSFLVLLMAALLLFSCASQAGDPIQVADLADDGRTQPSEGCGFGLGGNGNSPSEMCIVAAGAFFMGSPSGECEEHGGKCPDEKPQHVVAISQLLMDKHEVTNMQFLAFTLAESYWAAENDVPCDKDYLYSWQENDPSDSDCGKQPATWLCWDAAKAYCQWTGKRLPTEAEWEYAAKGSNHRVYPTGDEPPDCTQAIFEQCGVLGPGKVGGRPGGASIWGIEELAGNVAEWVKDGYSAIYYCGDSDLAACTEPDEGWQNPQGPPAATEKVVRGGGWSDELFWLRSSARRHFSPGETSPNIGFRCVATPTADHAVARGDR